MDVTPERVERFWAKVERAGKNDCWLWKAALHPTGYGLYYKGWAHRWSWVIEHGEQIPKGLYILHSCDNPPCVNPRHLRAADQKANMEDAVAKGRLGTAAGHGHGHIRTVREGVYDVCVSIGKDPTTGKYKQKWKRVNGTWAEADAVRVDLVASYQWF